MKASRARQAQRRPPTHRRVAPRDLPGKTDRQQWGRPLPVL